MPIKDADLAKLAGTVLESPSDTGTTYLLEEEIGGGSHGVVYRAFQRSSRGESRVVVKVLRPRALKELAGLAGTAIQKEVAALKRLSERDPPTPFVVRFFDSGSLRLGDDALDLPWIAAEYVDGGVEGSTLSARVEASIARTGFAFGAARARNAIDCIARGLTAIHEVSVVHRDVTPNNVLACGPAEHELFKLSDFGLARVSDARTFGDVLLGTPGYAAPEQSFPDKVGVGPYTDVFGFACTAFFLLTGEAYFEADNVPETFVAVHDPKRRSVLEAGTLAPGLRHREQAAAVDATLASATRVDPVGRPESPAAFCLALLAALR